MNIIIVGCGNVGFETAKLLASEHNLLLIDLHQPQYVTDFIKDRKDITFLQADATDVAQMEKAVKTFVVRHPHIDALISTIGAVIPGTPIDNFDVFKQNFEINFFGNLVPIKCVLDNMIAARSGKLIIMSSTTGHHSPKSLSAYAPSKWALENLSSSLRSELKSCGITVDVLTPASLKNRYSRTFISKYEIIEPTLIASRIKDILQRPKNTNHFIPYRYRMLHLVERMAPGLLDKTSGLKSRTEREKRLKKAPINNVLIVGASTDIGISLAYLNAKTTGKLYLVDEDEESLQKTKCDIKAKYGYDVNVAALKLSDRQSVKKYADSLDGVDLLVNITGQSAIGSVNDTPVGLYKQDLETNFFGVLYLLAELFNKQTKPKKVINVISSVAIAGRGNHSSYACRMAAFWSFTKSLRRIYGNELLVTEIITSSGKPAGHALASCHADVDFFAAVSRANATAQKIYCAEKNGKEIVFVPMKARFLLVLEALMPRLYSKVYA